MAQLTARHIARHGMPTRVDVVVRSPYSGKQCSVVSAKECGSNVELTLESGYSLFVKATQKVNTIKRIAK